MPNKAKIRATVPAGTRYAVIDIGSDTIHLLVADVREGRDGPQLEVVARSAVLLELGREVGAHGRFRSDAVKLIGSTVVSYVQKAEGLGAQLLLAATEATREAANGEEVVGQLAHRISHPIRILSGRREAQLDFVAAQPWLVPDGCQLLIDSGGASTEVVLTEGMARTSTTSIAVGASLLAAGLKGDPPDPLSWALSAARIGALLPALPAAHPVRAIATGGTVHNLAGLKGSGRRVRPTTLSVEDLHRLSRELLGKSSRQLGRASGEEPRRVRLLAPGVLILAVLLEHYGLGEVTVIPVGVREGIILAAHVFPSDWWIERDTDGPRQTGPEQLAPSASSGDVGERSVAATDGTQS